MFKTLLALIFILFSAYKIEAYSYTSYMDIKNLPLNQDKEDSISYDNGDVEDIENMLSVPPNTDIVFGVDGDFEDDIADAKIFLSKDNPYQGDLTKMFGISLPMAEFSFIKDGSTAWRYGRMYSIDNIVLNRGENDLLTLTLVQPLKVLEYTNTASNGVVNVKTVLKNDTDVPLNDVLYTHGVFSLTKNFHAWEEYTYEYSLEYNQNEQYLDLSFPSIYDPNTRQLCAASAYSKGNPYNIFLIEDSFIYHDLGIGSEEYEGFCITQIGYTLNLGKIEIGEKENVIEKKEDDENEVVEGPREEDIVDNEDIGEILGIDILPKTVVDIYGYLLLGIFLVAFGILCYYLTNENTVCNA